MRYLFFIAYLFFVATTDAQSKENTQKTGHYIQTIAFYNVENLFDYEDDPRKRDDDYTPAGRNKWTDNIYRQKLNNIAYVISQIGKKETHKGPVIIGLAEIENQRVLYDLIDHPHLKNENYGVLHFESPDYRGIDTALLYQKQFFQPIESIKYKLILINRDTGGNYYTRDILLVSGVLGNENIYVLVNHWPSRRGGQKRSAPGRKKAALLHQHITDSILSSEPEAKIISMGDYNDGPKDKSLSIISTSPFYNPYLSLKQKGLGSLGYRDKWFLFDQIILTKKWKEKIGYFHYKTNIFNPSYLRTPLGKYKNYPYRSNFKNSKLKGYSDHFPVYILVAAKVESWE